MMEGRKWKEGDRMLPTLSSAARKEMLVQAWMENTGVMERERRHHAGVC